MKQFPIIPAFVLCVVCCTIGHFAGARQISGHGFVAPMPLKQDYSILHCFDETELGRMLKDLKSSKCKCAAKSGWIREIGKEVDKARSMKKLKLLATVKPKKERLVLSPARLSQCMDLLAERGFCVSVKCLHVGNWHCEIKTRMLWSRVPKEQQQDFPLLCANSGYGHKTSYDAFVAAYKIHKKNAPQWFKKYGKDKEPELPALKLVA